MDETPNWHGPVMRLRSENGFYLSIQDDGKVVGTTDGNLDNILVVISSGEVSHVRIQGAKSKRYLCFNDSGNLYGEEDKNNDATVFKEVLQGSYNGYVSKIHPDWYVGIKKDGNPKNGKRTKWGKKSVKFLPHRNISEADLDQLDT
ncbi:fibroblast growth factor 1-like [Tribolium madens]|uniref:fibroblast growth factor 1-like n=1 Tax=Tribolium madens TaxID=41895 RepID=UPI001CF763F4|nr:fibroblast growth factor 1-like [Tribolium madens]